MPVNGNECNTCNNVDVALSYLLSAIYIWNEQLEKNAGGERGIRTPDRAFDPITV